MKHEILIYNKTERKVPEKFIKDVIARTLNFLRIKQPIEMAVLVVNKEEIKRLNKIWRKKNTIPDELSFGLNSRQIMRFAENHNGVLNLGEMVVNVEKTSGRNYLSGILIHSTLHLLGYSHKQMEGLENKILKSLEIRN